MKRTSIISLLILLFLFYGANKHTEEKNVTTPQLLPDNRDIFQAFEKKQSNIIVIGSGIVIKILSDDLKGSRHQRSIVNIEERLTLLISHNIDIAPRIDTLQKGDRITFKGEYEWNRQGGVVHWTHRAPQKKHPDGWIKHKGKLYN